MSLELKHKRVVPKDLIEIGLSREVDMGLKYVQKQFGGIYRAHCNSCYGDGPDITYEILYQENKDAHILFYLN